jgi:predicted lipase
MKIALIIGIILLLSSCSSEKDKDEDVVSGDKSNLPVSLTLLIEYAEYCKAIYDGGISIIVIRGTANASNVESDVNVALESDVRAGILLHKGFRDAAVTIMQIIDTTTKVGRTIVQGQTLQYPLEQTVHLTGHSLGGAVAQIMGRWLHKRGYSVQVFSYGSPKISTQSGNSPRHWRVVRKSDPIPFTPPWPYIHTGTFVNSKTLAWGPNNDNGLISETDGLDHAIAKYVTTLKEQL